MTADKEHQWDFVPIHKKYQRDHFDCGYPVLNDYLKKYAKQNHEKGIAKTFVAVSINKAEESQSLRVDGFYSIGASLIEFESLPESLRKGIPAYPIPSILIGKLAVNNAAKGQGLGGELLVDALLRSVRSAQEIGVFAVRVDAIDETAKAFYLKYEFIPLVDQPLSLFLPIASIVRAFS